MFFQKTTAPDDSSKRTSLITMGAGEINDFRAKVG